MSESQLRELFARHDPATEPPLPTDFLDRSLGDGRRRSNRRRGLTTSGVAAAVTLTIAAATTSLWVPDHRSTAGTNQPAATTQPNDAATLLSQISLAALDQKIDVRDDQFIYTKHQGGGWYEVEDSAGQVLRQRLTGVVEEWASVDGSKPGWVIGHDEHGNTYNTALHLLADPPFPFSPYSTLTTLPTEPDTLLTMIHASLKVGPGQTPSADEIDQSSFDMIGVLISQTLLPPKLGGALYQAAAKIPGVTVAEDAVDAAGRHGIAVTRASKTLGSTEWIFDRNTYDFLGERRVTPSGGGNIDTAVITRAVVDGARQNPN